MSLQWTAIGGFLYLEIFLTFLLMIPYINSSRWHRVFQSSLVKSLGTYANYYFTLFLVLLGVCFADSVREMRKYEHSDQAEAALSNNPNTVDNIHMKLFRAQRNFYIAGFSLFLWFVLRRLVTLISSEAMLSAGQEAAIKQAKSATEAAQRLMAADSDTKEKGDDAVNSKNEMDELRAKLRKANEQIKTQSADLEAIKKQAESTNREYDRLSADYQKLQDQASSSDAKKSS